MNIQFKLIENNRALQNEVLKALLPEVSRFIDSGIAKVKSALPNIIRQAIINTPEYNSLLNGELKYEFGIANVDSKLSSLLTAWSTNIQYSYRSPSIKGSSIKGSFSANCIKVDFSDVLYTDYAAVVDTIRGYSLPWLEWLLLDGNKTIVKNYEVVVGPFSNSRTGLAVMKPSRKAWRVPSQFSGTINDNWITRAIDTVESDILKMMDGAFV